jgi:uncharacterized protein
MIIDLNAHLGHYPFRRTAPNTPEDVLAMMDRWGIAKAVVTNLNALLYRNAHAANEQLYDMVDGRRDRLIPIATIDPAYAGWEGDLERVLDWGMKGVRLLPNYHRYELDDSRARELVSELAARDVPAVFHESFEDNRQRHPWDASGDLHFHRIGPLLENYPNLRVMFLCGRHPGGAMANVKADLKGRVLACFSRMQSLLHQQMQGVLKVLGPRGLAAGTHYPLYEPATLRVKLDALDLPESDLERVACRNAAEFLGVAV